MSKGQRVPQRLWSMILAGGEGERIRPMIQRWLGRHRPKQYCAFVGTRSMFQHTIDRATTLTAAARTVTVIARSHHREAFAQLDGRKAGTVLLQPENRDTAAGVFLPLTYVRAHDPHALVVVYPSDHFVYPETRFLDTVAAAACCAERFRDRLILLGVPPTRPEIEYGWIQPDRLLSLEGRRPLRDVRAFLEKPTREQAESALALGALWNTLVFAARVSTVWELGQRCFPEVIQRFDRLLHAIGTFQETMVLQAIYADMPRRNFSSDLLERVPDRVAVMELNGVLWSDWGKPERIAETIRHIGRRPAFPPDCLEEGSTPVTMAG